MTRRVLVLCGPPGAGKTTEAHATGLEVLDLDDARWSSPRVFRRALLEVGRDSAARVAVIRSGATRSARARVAELVAPTELRVLEVPAAECARRVRLRGRADPPLRTQLAAVDAWWRRYEPPDPAELARYVTAGPVLAGAAPRPPVRSWSW